MDTFPRLDSPVSPVFGNYEELQRRITELGEWFHNLDLHGVPTAPEHFLGDFPNIKWKHIQNAIPQDLTGANVLDIGCNGGFYSIQMKQRGAQYVLGIDIDDRYLNQARFAAQTLELEIDFRKGSVYKLDEIVGNRQFDYVLFMGVLYHLRYPLFALDQLIKKVKGTLIFQTMIRGSAQTREWSDNYSFWTKDIFLDPAFPVMFFVEKSYANDRTNWWIPNRSAAEAMLRSAGLEITSHPEEETWVCRPTRAREGDLYIVDRELEGTL